MSTKPKPALKRREFIKRTFAVSAALAFGNACQHSRRANAAEIDPELIKRFGAGMKGRIILPTDPSFESTRRVFFWNPITEKRPSIVVHCAHTDDVVRSIEFARIHKLEIAVRGGGHSPCAWGTGNGLVIDLSGMKQTEINPRDKIARVDAGVLSGEITSQADRHGLAPVFGQSPEVGAAGVLLGGGLGWLAGIHGAACDNLLSARLVTANGELLTVNASSHPDLFWAIRGGSGNFGVVTSFQCRLFRIGAVTAGELRYPIRDARPVLQLFRDVMEEVPDTFQATLDLSPRNGFVSLRVFNAGGAAETHRLLQPFGSVARTTADTVKEQHFAVVAGTQPGRSSPAVSTGSKYIQTVYREKLSDEVIDQVLHTVDQAPAQSLMAVSHYMHGQVCRVKPEDTAFSLRKPGGVHIRFNVAWNDPAAAESSIAWADGARRAMGSPLGERIYTNYQSYEGATTAVAVFGGNHARLATIKGKYDPDNLFHRNSNVQPKT